MNGFPQTMEFSRVSLHVYWLVSIVILTSTFRFRSWLFRLIRWLTWIDWFVCLNEVGPSMEKRYSGLNVFGRSVNFCSFICALFIWLWFVCLPVVSSFVCRLFICRVFGRLSFVCSQLVNTLKSPSIKIDAEHVWVSFYFKQYQSCGFYRLLSEFKCLLSNVFLQLPCFDGLIWW